MRIITRHQKYKNNDAFQHRFLAVYVFLLTDFDKHVSSIMFIYTLLNADMHPKSNGPQLEKTYFLMCAPNDDSDQPAHPRSLISVFVVHVKKLCVLDYLKCARWRSWSDCGNAQANLKLHWAHVWRYFSDVTSHYASTRKRPLCIRCEQRRSRPAWAAMLLVTGTVCGRSSQWFRRRTMKALRMRSLIRAFVVRSSHKALFSLRA